MDSSIQAYFGALLFVAFFRLSPELVVVFVLGTVTALALVLPSVFAWVSTQNCHIRTHEIQVGYSPGFLSLATSDTAFEDF